MGKPLTERPVQQLHHSLDSMANSICNAVVAGRWPSDHIVTEYAAVKSELDRRKSELYALMENS